MDRQKKKQLPNLTESREIKDETGLTNSDGEKLPLVMVHGFAAGVGIWSLNFDAICKDRKIYAFDLPGFGRSSRPEFNFSDSQDCEWQIVQAIERWRVAVGLNEKFILLGHSFGGCKSKLLF